jgi:hypothetical protein
VLLETLDEAIIYDFPEDAAAVRAHLERGITLLRKARANVIPRLADWNDVRKFLSEDRAGAGVRYSVPLEDDFPDVIERFAEHDPMSAILPALLLVREWERTSPKWLMRSSEGARDWGWNKLVVPLARILLKCDAIWSGTLIVDWSAGVLRKAGPEHLDGSAAEALYQFGTLRGQFNQRHYEYLKELAWYLAREAVGGNRVVIACLAALYWTLGDVQQAQELKEGRSKLSAAHLQVMLDAALRVSADDPMIGGVASRLQHEDVYTRVHDSMRRRLTRWLGNSRLGTAFESLGESLGASPGKIYGDVLVKWFMGIVANTDVRAAQTLASAVTNSMNHPVVSVRSTALAYLVTDPADGDGAWWWRLADWCAEKTELQHWTGSNGRYEAPLDLPLSYIEGSNDAVLHVIENQRWGTLAQSAWYSVPEILGKSSGKTAQEINDILQELRMLRFIVQLPRLPDWVAQVIRINWHGEEVNPREWSDDDQAYEKALGHRTRLREIAAELQLSGVDIASIPILGGASLQDFAAILE